MKISEKLKSDYPMIGEKAAQAVVSLMESLCDTQDDDSIQETMEIFSSLLSTLEEDYTSAAQNESLLAEEKNNSASAQEFKKAVSEELIRREVPEYFWKAALELDDNTAQWNVAADAIETQYKAFLQKNNDENMTATRPLAAVRAESHSAAVEAYIRSLRSDSPLAGKLKE